jgi:hypothetical protein
VETIPPPQQFHKEADLAYVIEIVTRVGWVPDGAGGAAIVGAPQANVPGEGASRGPRPVFNAQVLQDIQAEGVIAANPDAPTAAEFKTAMTKAATDTNTNFFTAANVATLQGYASGNP